MLACRWSKCLLVAGQNACLLLMLVKMLACCLSKMLACRLSKCLLDACQKCLLVACQKCLLVTCPKCSLVACQKCLLVACQKKVSSGSLFACQNLLVVAFQNLLFRICLTDPGQTHDRPSGVSERRERATLPWRATELMRKHLAHVGSRKPRIHECRRGRRCPHEKSEQRSARRAPTRKRRQREKENRATGRDFLLRTEQT